MPLIQLETSCDLSDAGRKASLAQALSRLAAEGIGKPEKYVMASVHSNMAMTMSGQNEPCALVTIKSIGGLSRAVNQTLTARICETLKADLALPSDRVYITFEELASTHWGWNGDTFG